MEELLGMLFFAAILGLIPGFIAKSKGYSFGAWWLYGFLIFIVAIIHVLFIPNKKNIEQKVINDLERYKKLFEEGIITEEEFQSKKEELKAKLNDTLREE
jgi:putative phage-related membrane protein